MPVKSVHLVLAFLTGGRHQKNEPRNCPQHIADLFEPDANRIVEQVGIALRRLDLRVAEKLADHRQRHAARNEQRLSLTPPPFRALLLLFPRFEFCRSCAFALSLAKSFLEVAVWPDRDHHDLSYGFIWPKTGCASIAIAATA